MTGTKIRLPQVFTVKSSAGAGKTYRLAQHYIALLVFDALSGRTSRNRISDLVAITFTNKAAQEMRGRVIDWMKRIIFDVPFDNSSLKPIDAIMESEWLKGAGGHSEHSIRKTISENFDDLLKDYYSFNVSTIDSFVNLILKASAFRLDLPPDFEISLDSSSSMELVLKLCLQQITEDESVRAIFDRFIDNYTEIEGNNTSWLPKNILRDTFSLLWNEELKENRDFILNPRYRETTANLRKSIEDAAVTLKASLARNPELLPKTNFLNGLESCIHIKGHVPGKGVSFEIESLDACLKKGSMACDPSQQFCWDTLLKLRPSYVEAISESKFMPYLEAYDYFKRVLSTAVTHRQRIVLIEQLNRLLQNVLLQKGFVPEIYYSLSERFSHFMIDEFQDTNHLQWKNIEALTEEAVSRGGTLFIVGDKKQAIYRWRGGKSEIVDEVTTRFAAYQAQDRILTTNFRSDGEIVRFNNAAFSKDNLTKLVDALLPAHSNDSKEDILRAYCDSEQDSLYERKAKGYVHIERVTAEDDNGDATDVFTKAERNIVMAGKLRALISGIRARKVFKDSDIAILVRKKDEARLVVRTLLEMGINVESELTVNVKNNPLVKELISFMHFIDLPDDDFSFASFITGAIFRIRTGVTSAMIEEWLIYHRLSAKRQPLYIIFRTDFNDVWQEYFEEFFKTSGYLPVYEFVVLFLRRWSVLSLFPDDAPYFLHICELIKNRESTESGNLNSFLSLLSDNDPISFGASSESEKPFLLRTSGAADAIKVLTIHKAKGLEFPVVILPFVKLTSFSASDEKNRNQFLVNEGDGLRLLYIKKDFRDISPRLRAVYQEREVSYLLDELNNLYVALTRAEKELYLFLTDAKGHRRNHLIDYIFNLPDFSSCSDGTRIERGNKYMPESPPLDREEITSSSPVILFEPAQNTAWFTGNKLRIGEGGPFSRQQIFAKKRGDVLHYILSLIHSLPRTKEDLEHFIAAGVAKYNFAAHLQSIRQTITDFFANSLFRQFFTIGDRDIVFNEKEIIDERGVVHIIDRLIVHNDT
ncbi:MAG TPA: UvrD-helicase domain-containing protein, partial [Syntrophorhabdaceae bacterium]|nr:UvrD-helicase domain-containing protein [Syntrophorhabdaceae bacterium]